MKPDKSKAQMIKPDIRKIKIDSPVRSLSGDKMRAFTIQYTLVINGTEHYNRFTTTQKTKDEAMGELAKIILFDEIDRLIIHSIT